MPYEVEQKYPVVDLDSLTRKLQELGAEPLGEKLQSDTYYNHPSRDFATTDEAFRLRRDGDHACFTYKGPKVDSTTKTRRGGGVALAGALAPAAELLADLGFQRVAEVRKTRRCLRLVWQGTEVEVALDEVERLGRFIELEIVADGPSQLDAARQVLANLASHLGLSGSERRGYIQIMLAEQGGN